MVPTVVPRTCWCMERKDVAFEYCQSVFARCFWAVGDLGSYFSTTLHHLPLSFTTTPHHSLLPFIHYYILIMHHSLPCTLHRSPFITTRHANIHYHIPLIVHYLPFITTGHATFTTMYPSSFTITVHYNSSCIIHY